MSNERITAPTLRDVLSGRGQGVQRHSGNVKYRALVFVNKGLYAKCPRSDKIKISKGIVAAVRELGGRFLELDERSGIYFDIGDKKATEKTSQALREGQVKIRKEMYKAEEKGGQTGHKDKSNDITGYDTSLLTPSFNSAATAPTSNIAHPSSNAPNKEVSQEGYFGYSVQVLEALYNSENSVSKNSPPQSLEPVTSSSGTPSKKNMPSFRIGTADQPSYTPASLTPPTSGVPIITSSETGAPAAFSASIAKAAEQFPTGVTFQQPFQQYQHPPQTIGRIPQRPNLSRTEAMASNVSLSRPSNFSVMSMGSLVSFRQLIDSSRDIANSSSSEEERKSIQSILTTEIVDLIRQSESRLRQIESNIENMNFEDFVPSEQDLVCFEEDSSIKSADRFSDLSNPRFSSDSSGNASKNTILSRNSLMDASLMSIPKEDMMSVSSGIGSGEGSVSKRHKPSIPAVVGEAHPVSTTGTSAMSLSTDDGTDLAHLLLRLSNDSVGDKNKKAENGAGSSNFRQSLLRTNGQLNVFKQSDGTNQKP